MAREATVAVGRCAVSADFPGTAHVVRNVAWGVAIAVGILLVFIVYTLAKRMTKEAKE